MLDRNETDKRLTALYESNGLFAKCKERRQGWQTQERAVKRMVANVFFFPFATEKSRYRKRGQEMNENERMKILNKIEELGTRVGALAAAAKLIEDGGVGYE